MTGFSAAAQSSLCATISHRVLAAAVELDETDGNGQYSALSTLLRAYSKTAESLAGSITRAPAVSQTLQAVLSGFLDSCAHAAAVLEKESRTLRVDEVGQMVLSPQAISTFEDWTAQATHVFELLQQSTQVSDLREQEAILHSSGVRQVLEDCKRASGSVIEASSKFIETDDEQPPEYGDSAPDYPNDVKNPSLFETSPSSANAASATAGPSEPRQARGGLASLSEAFKAMTAPFRYKPEPLVVALCEASARGNTNNIASLITSGANINGRDENGKTPIVRAIEGNHIEVVRKLLDLNASREVCDTAKKIPPLFWAAEGGDIAITRLLLHRGCSPREKSIYGGSYLVDTVTKASVEVVKLLLSYGADVHATDTMGRELIYHAFSKGSFDMMKLLQKWGANVNAQDMTGTPLAVLALQKDRIEVLRFLIDHGADVNGSSTAGTPLLVEALQKGRLDIMKMLLDRGANPNVSDMTGTPVILLAIKSTKYKAEERIELVRLLLSRGANPNTVDSWGWTPMSYVIDKGYTEIISLLIQRGADPNQTISTGEPLLLHALEKKVPELVTQLLRHGANPNIVDKRGRTPLLEALRKRDLVTAKQLIQHGADPNKEAMISPLAFAKAALGDADMATLLRTYGAIPDADDVARQSSQTGATQSAGQPTAPPQAEHTTSDDPPDYDAVFKQ